MALEGDLSIFRLPDILQVIAQQGKTGILTVQGEHDILAVSFHQGQVVAADALNQSFEEMLGQVLASQGVLSPDRFQRLAEEHRSTAGERLADFLIRRDALTREQLLAALRFQTYRLLLEVLRWREGEFKFYGGEEVAFEEGVEPLGVDEILFRSMRDLLGEGTVAGALPHGFVAYVRVPSSRPLRVAREGASPAEHDGDVQWISPDEAAVLDRLDGRTVAEELGRELGLGDVRTQYALFHLLRAGLVRPASAEPEAPEPPPASGTGAAAASADGPGGAPARASRPERAEPAEPAPRRERPPRPTLVPPLEATGAGEVPEERSVPAGAAAASSAVAGIAALLGVAALVLAILRPALLLMPYPAQRAEREGLARLEIQARLASIDRGARSFYLLEGRYPASLEDLVARSLLAPSQRSLPGGDRLVMEPAADAYRLAIAGDPEAAGYTESVAGDILLDRTLFAGVQDETGVPLVLLD
ncbi:MAG: hypothetical protein AMXMBFR36_19400 [Acidobacteriota bacterium]